MGLNRLNAKEQLIWGLVLISIFVCLFIFTREYWIVQVSWLDRTWGKIGIFVTMFATIMTFYPYFVLSGYRKAKLELNIEKVEQLHRLSDAHQASNEKGVKELNQKISALDEQGRLIDKQKSKVDVYGNVAIGLGIVGLQIGLWLQLFSA